MLEYMTRNKILLITGMMILVMFAMSLSGSSVYGEEEADAVGPLEDPMETREAQIEERDYVEHQALVMFEDPTDTSDKSTRTKQLRKTVSDLKIVGLWAFNGGEMKSTKNGTRKLVKGNSEGSYSGVALVESKSLDADTLVKKLRKRNDVKYAEKNWKVYARGVSDDALSDFQWSMGDGDNTPNVRYEWEDNGTSGSENVVALLDTGVDYNHPDIKDNMWRNPNPTGAVYGRHGYNFIKGNADPMDGDGHGTHCAGIIGAVGDNGIGISGVNKNIKIMALKTLDDMGMASLSHEIQAYNYIDVALDAGVPIRAINNSWGGGGYSEIFADLVDIVGEKGAISVCAAGNASSDNDRIEDYPSCIDSPYLVSVASTDRDGKISEYSNYGRDTVDVAAPGSEILSTVSYESYNPSIYDDPSELSQEFNNYSDPDYEWGRPAAKDPSDPEDEGEIFLNGKPYDDGEGLIALDDDRRVHITDKGFADDNSMGIDITGMEKDEILCLSIPYSVSTDAEEAPVFSIMAKVSGPEDPGHDMGSLFAFTDMKKGGRKDLSLVDESNFDNLYGTWIDGETSIYDHYEMEALADEDMEDLQEKAKAEGKDSIEREIVLIVYAYVAGNYHISLDDMGLSKEDIAGTGAFGQYDFMSGTSMAAPYITGAMALKAAELDAKATAGTKTEPETVINETVSLAKPEPVDPTGQKVISQHGSFDFTKHPGEGNLPPRVGIVTVQPKNGTVTINGSGLGYGDVWIGDDPLDEEEDKVTDRIKERSDRKIVLQDNGWINNIKTVKVKANDRESIRHDVYMVRGKTSLTKSDTNLEPITGAMATDGRKIYFTNSVNRCINVVETYGKEIFFDQLSNIDPTDYFKGKKKNTGEYGMIFGEDLAYSNGKLYTTVEYGLIQTPEDDDDGWFILGRETINSTSQYTEKIQTVDGTSTIYSGEKKIFSIDRNSGEVKDLGKLYEDAKKTSHLTSTVDWTMASYNGKLYFIGGYDYTDSRITTKVWILDPATKKWSAGKDLPEGRAGGKAIQVGNKLVYTLGYSDKQTGEDPMDQKHPANLIFDGKKWTKSKVSDEKAIEPLVVDRVVTRDGNQYIATEGNIGLVKGAVIYTGYPVCHYGDVFTYDVAGDTFKDTGCNFIDRPESDEIRGIAVGKTLYGFDGDEFYTMPISSGLVNVTAPKYKKGSIKGTGSFMPGTTANVTVKAAKNYRIKSIKAGGSKVKVGKADTKKVVKLSNLSSDKKVTAAFVKYKAVVKAKKKGKGKITGARTYVIGKKATIKIKAAKGYYIKSVKQGSKTIKVKKNATSKTFKFKVKKDVTVNVVFAKK